VPLAHTDDESAEPQTLDQIISWHHDLVDALVARRAVVLVAIRTGGVVPEQYLGLTEDEVEDRHTGQRRELDRLTVLNLVACAEAGVRLDYLQRVKGRLKDTLSKAYRKWAKQLPKKSGSGPISRVPTGS